MEYPEENALNIYTDGSMLQSPWRGGAGLLFIAVDNEGNEDRREEMLAGWSGATQNQMELEAVIQGLKMATGRRPPFDPSTYRRIVVKTDATYVAANFGAAASRSIRGPAFMRREVSRQRSSALCSSPETGERIRLHGPP